MKNSIILTAIILVLTSCHRNPSVTIPTMTYVDCTELHEDDPVYNIWHECVEDCIYDPQYDSYYIEYDDDDAFEWEIKIIALTKEDFYAFVEWYNNPQNEFSACPTYGLREVVRPTGWGDSYTYYLEKLDYKKYQQMGEVE